MPSRVSSARMLQLLRPIAEGVVRAAAHLLWWKIRGLFAQKGKKKKEIGPESETCLREVSHANRTRQTCRSLPKALRRLLTLQRC